jgi:5-methylcytosine-specific restriction protein A
MGRLTNLRPQLSPPASCLRPLDNVQKQERLSWRHLYHTARWKKLRSEILLRDAFTCAMCQRLAVHGMVIDHKTPHRGDLRLFWSEANLQVLCATCHSSTKQSLEAAGRI